MLNAGKIVKLPMMRLGVPIVVLALLLGMAMITYVMFMLIIYRLCLHNDLRFYMSKHFNILWM